MHGPTNFTIKRWVRLFAESSITLKQSTQITCKHRNPPLQSNSPDVFYPRPLIRCCSCIFKNTCINDTWLCFHIIVFHDIAGLVFAQVPFMVGCSHKQTQQTHVVQFCTWQRLIGYHWVIDSRNVCWFCWTKKTEKTQNESLSNFARKATIFGILIHAYLFKRKQKQRIFGLCPSRCSNNHGLPCRTCYRCPVKRCRFQTKFLERCLKMIVISLLAGN